jgi:hypothetical protein
MKSIAVVLLMVPLVLTGCATSYQKSGFTGGFSETQLGEDLFQVSFRGNGYTGHERATDFTLLRSADIAIAHGFKYFTIVDSEKSSSESTYTTPTNSYTTATASAYGNTAYGNAHTTTYGGQTYRISKPRTSNLIRCFKEKPEGNGIIFEASFVSKSIREKYGITE